MRTLLRCSFGIDMLADVAAVRICGDLKLPRLDLWFDEVEGLERRARNGFHESFYRVAERAEILEIERPADIRVHEAFAGLPVVHGAGHEIALPLHDVLEQTGYVVLTHDIAVEKIGAAHVDGAIWRARRDACFVPGCQAHWIPAGCVNQKG